MELNQPTLYWRMVGAIAAIAGLITATVGVVIWKVISQISTLAQVSLWTQAAIIGMLPLCSVIAVGLTAFFLSRFWVSPQGRENRFRTIFEGAAIGIGLDNLDGTILESNSALQTMLGYSHKELASMTFSQFTHPDDVAIDERLFSEMIAGDRSFYQIEKRHINKDQQLRWIRLTNSLVRDKVNNPRYTIAVVEDITSLKQAQESIQLYSDIVKRMQLGLLVWQMPDPNDVQSLRLVECNPAAQQILQITAAHDQLIGKPLAALFPELLETDIPNIYAEIIRSGEGRNLCEGCYGDTTSQQIFAMKAFPLPNRCLGLVVEDITERKQAEDALQQSEARFRVVAETAACMFLIFQGNALRYVNPIAETISEYTRDELMAMNFWDTVHPDFQALVRDRGLARQSGAVLPNRYEFKILTKSGKECWLDATAGLITLAGKPAVLATGYDITERKQAEEQLQLAADRERLLWEISLRIRSSLNLEEILQTTVAEVRQFLQADRVVIGGFEPDVCCRTVAESVGEGWKPALGWEIEAREIAEIKQLFEPDTVRVIHNTEQVEKTAFVWEYYTRCQVKADMGIPIMLNGEMFGVLAINQCSAPRHWQPFEVDLLKKLGTQVEIAIQQGQLYQQLIALASNLESQVEDRTVELQRRMQELQNLNEVKDLLLHAVSHDLRTPIQGTLMVLNHLRSKECETVPVTRSMLDCMIASSDRQLSLLNSLMEAHADTQVTLSLNREPIDLSKVFEQAIATQADLLTHNEAVIVNQISLNLPTINADPIKLQHVLENLLANAVKHNPPNRTITFTATFAPEAYPNCLYCAVTDDGTGMTQTQCDRLFQLYARSLDQQHLTGIGVGLYRCQQIISAHAGKIGVHSTPGHGSTLWFTIPFS
ncbi:PAS domain S-box protein [Leptolyngbyaceae cyanobacterium UHCC 1019]